MNPTEWLDDDPGPRHDLLCHLMAVSDADAVCTCRSTDGHTDHDSTAARLDQIHPVPLPCDEDAA